MCLDLNRDGFEDMIVNNGHVLFHPQGNSVRQLPLILINRKGAAFDRIQLGDGTYLDTPHVGRGFAIGDLDNDGDYDLGFTNNDDPSALLRNDSTDGNSWLRVRLIGRGSNRDAIGARLILESKDDKFVRWVKSGASYLSHSDVRPLFGIPKGTELQSMTIHWPSGKVQKITSLRAGDDLTLLETANE